MEPQAGAAHLGQAADGVPGVAHPLRHVRDAQIAAAESELRALDFKQFRVRYHQDVARIELASEEYPRFFEAGVRERINGAFKSLGFKFVALDLEPFRSGRLNEAAGIAPAAGAGQGTSEGFKLPVVG